MDFEALVNYEFFYSYDGGDIYLPIESEDSLLNSINFKFTATYDKYLDVKVKCKVTNAMGFSN